MKPILNTKKSQFQILFLNIQCLKNKTSELELVLEKFKDVNVLCVAEHWMNRDEIGLYNITDFYVGSITCRTQMKHGGTAIYVKDNLTSTSLDNINNLSIEGHCEISAIKIKEANIILACLYRPPTGDKAIFMDTFEQAVTIMRRNHVQIIITGDFNMDFIMEPPNRDLNMLMYQMQSHGLTHLVKEPTRHSQKCIDNILTNATLKNITEIEVTDLGLSDHYAVFVKIPNTTANQHGPKTNNTISTTQCNIDTLRQLASLVTWNESEQGDVNIIFQSFFDKLVDIVDKSKYIKKHKSSHKPRHTWYTELLRVERDRLFLLTEAHRNHPSADLSVVIKRLKKKYRHNIGLAKRYWNSKFIAENHNKQKAIWHVIKQNTNTSLKSVANNEDKTPTANELNTFYSTIAENINSTLPQVNQVSVHSNNTSSSFFLEPVDEIEVYRTIKNLSNSKSTDIYDMNTYMIKEIADYITLPLTNIFNTCFLQGCFPTALKTSKVIPIKKKENSTEPADFRPIALIPLIGKILEKVIKTRLQKYLEKYNLLSHNQFGFRANRSTTKAVIQLVEFILNSFEKNEYTATIICDLSKAFDSISHELLHRKLEEHGIRGVPLKLFQSYLTDRSQQVYYKNTLSKALPINYGVPQGSVLGPLLFLIYINNIENSISKEMVLFADDSTIYWRNKYFTDLMNEVDVTLDKTSLAFAAHRLCLNKTKTQTIIFGLRHLPVHYDNVKLLGFSLDSTLSWHSQINTLAKKLAKALYALRRLAQYAEQSMLSIAYFALFHSILSYGIILWGNASGKEVLFKLQKQAIRTIAKAGYRQHCKPLFRNLKIMTLPALYIYQCVLHIKSTVNIESTTNRHTHNTRHKNLLLKDLCRLQKTTSHFKWQGTTYYNLLQEDIRKLPRESFKSKVKHILLQMAPYSVEEYMQLVK